MASSSSRQRSSSPFGFRRGSPSPTINGAGRSMNMLMPPRHASLTPASSASSYGSSYGAPRSVTPSRARSESPSSDFFRYNSNGNYAVSPADFTTSGAESMISMDQHHRKGKENVCVTVRFRPLSAREYQKGDEIAWYADGDTLVRSEYNPSTCYAFDRVFGPATTTKGVYDVAAKHVVRGAMEGVNGTVFAYGVTSSGKTHTMHGDQKSPGVIPLAIKDVFDIIQDTPGQEFLLRVSYLEIYNEVINDLLDSTGQNLRIREDAQGTYVEGIKEEVVLSPAHALSLIAAGEEHRHVGSNNFNLFSSRSHTIFTLTIESSVHGSGYDEVTLSQLNLIDLAGSESSKTETTGLRRKEGSYINKSLLTLGTVIGKLSDGKASHIPYRDSKLTRLLQSSLSGHGHVSLICTVTPASSNMEETHNTLKFAQRAKRVEIRAAPNRIIEEKSLIKKYQREITNLKHELDQLKRGILVSTSQEELITLRQQLEAGQAIMQSRLEEEEQAKAALMGRIQKLTKLILVSTKNSVNPNFSDTSANQRRRSLGGDEKLDIEQELMPTGLDSDISRNGSPPSVISIDSLTEGKTGTTMADHLDLLIEQVKVLAGEVAFNTSSLKRLSEQAANNPQDSKIQEQIKKLEAEIEEKKQQMKVLEQRITGTGEYTTASPAEMQQTIGKLMSQCNEKAFDLEITAADNRILQDRLQAKESENRQLLETINSLRQQPNLWSESLGEQLSNSGNEQILSTENGKSENSEELQRQILLQSVELEKIKQENVRLNEENDGLQVQCQKLSEEASYAKELASAAAVELKTLAEECTKLSFQNSKLTKDLAALQEQSVSRGSSHKISGSVPRRGSDGRLRKPRLGNGYDDMDSLTHELEEMRREVHARQEREAMLEAALAEKENAEAEYQKRIDEWKRRETDLENDLAGMWVLVAKMKKERVAAAQTKTTDEENNTPNIVKVQDEVSKGDEHKDRDSEEQLRNSLNDEKKRSAEMAALIARLKSENLDGLELSALEDLQSLHVEALTKLCQAKARMQEQMEKVKELESANGEDTNADGNASYLCKVCFEAPTAAVLLPCRHFCLCKPCAVACAECPLCRTKIQDRIIAFTS